MNYKRYINMILLQLSNKYHINYIESKTYKHQQKFTNIKIIIHKYDGENKKYYKTIEEKSERAILYKLKEMI